MKFREKSIKNLESFGGYLSEKIYTQICSEKHRKDPKYLNFSLKIGDNLSFVANLLFHLKSMSKRKFSPDLFDKIDENLKAIKDFSNFNRSSGLNIRPRAAEEENKIYDFKPILLNTYKELKEFLSEKGIKKIKKELELQIEKAVVKNSPQFQYLDDLFEFIKSEEFEQNLEKTCDFLKDIQYLSFQIKDPSVESASGFRKAIDIGDKMKDLSDVRGALTKNIHLKKLEPLNKVESFASLKKSRSVFYPEVESDDEMEKRVMEYLEGLEEADKPPVSIRPRSLRPVKGGSKGASSRESMA